MILRRKSVFENFKASIFCQIVLL